MTLYWIFFGLYFLWRKLVAVPHSFLGENNISVSFLNLLVYSLGPQWILGKTLACSHPAWGCKIVRSHKLDTVLGSGQDLDRRTQKKEKKLCGTHICCAPDGSCYFIFCGTFSYNSCYISSTAVLTGFKKKKQNILGKMRWL